jgi:peroxiredoxin
MKATDFSINLPDGKETTLFELLSEKKVLLNFIPFAFTGVCEGELCEIRDNLAQYQTADTQVVTVSCDAQPSINEFRNKLGIDYIYTTDFYPHGEISKAYGIFNEELGCANRVSFLIAQNGEIISEIKADNLGVSRDMEHIKATVSGN